MTNEPSLTAFVHSEPDGTQSARLSISGIHCAGCVNAIERRLATESDIRSARVHFGTHQLHLVWDGPAERLDSIAGIIRSLGYGVTPTSTDFAQEGDEVKSVLRALVWAGFGMGNIMLFSWPVWLSDEIAMGPHTRQLMHWFMALIALVVVPIAGQPFFKSAYAVLRQGRTNMDVPISVGVTLATLASLYGLFANVEHVYFDSAVMLLFFLLIGRYLDVKLRARARGAAASVLSLLAATATIVDDDGVQRLVPLSQIQAGATLLVAAGERVMADGVVTDGAAQLDTSLLSGETHLTAVGIGDAVTSGSIPVDAPLRLRVSVPHEETLLAQIVKTMQQAQQNKARLVLLAEKIARAYTPTVHTMAAITFVGWLWQGATITDAVMHAVAVLIITCPCALGLAVPVVQILAASRLMKRSVLLKTGDALERLSQVDAIALDKTGTVTLGRPVLQPAANLQPDDLPFIMALAGASAHPLSRALSIAFPKTVPAALSNVTETRGRGMEGRTADGATVRLGSRAFVGAQDNLHDDDLLELWFQRPDGGLCRLAFADALRPDAAQAVGLFKRLHLQIMMLSGDRVPVVQKVAESVGITLFSARLSPLEKAERMQHAAQEGHKILMVGDGLNDAPGLSAAHAAIAPQTGMDITQNAADAIFLGERLTPVAEAVHTARFAQRLVVQNFRLAILYNILAVPLAVVGIVTPLVAALAMSSSSMIVVANALRLIRLKDVDA